MNITRNHIMMVDVKPRGAFDYQLFLLLLHSFVQLQTLSTSLCWYLSRIVLPKKKKKKATKHTINKVKDEAGWQDYHHRCLFLSTLS